MRRIRIVIEYDESGSDDTAIHRNLKSAFSFAVLDKAFDGQETDRRISRKFEVVSQLEVKL